MEQVPAAVHAASGAVGGSIANALLYPLDVVTVRLQVQRDADAASARRRDKIRETDPKRAERLDKEADVEKPASLAEMFREIVHNEGWSSLFEGIGDDLVATVTQTFIYFFVYDYMRNKQIRYHIHRRGSAPHTFGIKQELFFGAVAGMFCKLFTTPLKNVVVLKQTDRTHSLTFKECFKEIYRHKGLLGLWSGYRATLFLSINPSLSYYFYQRLAPLNQGKESSSRVFARAALAKSVATVLTYPVILQKTRTQAKQGPSNLYRDLLHTYSQNGVTGLYDGVNGQLLKGCFTQGITMATKERISRCVVYIYMHIILARRQKAF